MGFPANFDRLQEELVLQEIEGFASDVNSDGDICEVTIYTVEGLAMVIKAAGNQRLVFETGGGPA